jgi:C-terminal processing protease CtpA/Prc
MISPRDFGADSLFVLQDSSCRKIVTRFNTTTGSSFYPYSYPSGFYETQILENERVAYLCMSTFLWEDIESDINSIVNFLQQVEDYDYLIIDIRGNLGGNYRSWIETLVKPLIHEESVFESYLAYRTSDYSDSVREAFGIVNEVPKSAFEYLPTEVYGPEFKIYNYQHTFTPSFEVNFDGEIILLVDHIVYSAAEGFTSFCKQTGFATIYGTTSGGDGIMEFPNHFVLPNSKLVINLSSALGLDYNRYASEEVRTQPDVFYESSYGNFTELIDFVLANLP